VSSAYACPHHHHHQHHLSQMNLHHGVCGASTCAHGHDLYDVYDVFDPDDSHGGRRAQRWAIIWV
jgi:hypothetical protein